jgi:hypothetical protein
MPGLVPGIHAFLIEKGVDGRDKPGHDADESSALYAGIGSATS